MAHGLSISKACSVMSISKTSYYYTPKLKQEDDSIKHYLLSLSVKHQRWGFDKMRDKSRLDKKGWNHKRIYRVYCELGLNLRIKPRKRLPKGEANSLVYPIRANICWSIDFMTDVLENGQRFRTFNVIDDFNREGLLIDVAFSFPSKSVVQSLKKLISNKGKPAQIRMDNGPEFISNEFKSWAKEQAIELLFIQPGKPAQNGFVERFNRTFRGDILDMYIFSSLPEVSELSKKWLDMYNNERPHESLKGLTPALFSQRIQARAAL